MSRPISVLLLAAGYGRRLRPFTDNWPKCLMPINRRPLLEYWLDAAKQLGAKNVLVNTHYLADVVQRFLDRPRYRAWVRFFYEPELKGTAGTLRVNSNVLRDTTILMAHADNFCQCDFHDFLKFHQISKPKHLPLTMMTFHTRNPEACGIVETNQDGVATLFREKVKNPPGNIANGAVYLLEPEVLQWVLDRPEITDFSTQVLPEFMGRVATWRNEGTHIDIGSIESLREAQTVVQYKEVKVSEPDDEWSVQFSAHPIHRQIEQGMPLPPNERFPTL